MVTLLALLGAAEGCGAGLVVCLPPNPADGTYASEIVLSLSRGAPLGPPRPRPELELFQSWWMGSSPATIVVRRGRIEARARVLLQYRTHPASFTGGVADEIVELRGTLAITSAPPPWAPHQP